MAVGGVPICPVLAGNLVRFSETRAAISDSGRYRSQLGSRSIKLAELKSPIQPSNGGLSSPALTHSHKRDASAAGLDASPGSGESIGYNDVDEQSRKRPVKRACNECRQQKVRDCPNRGCSY